jgi:hypothetical protein
MRNKLILSIAGAAFSFAASGLAFAADMARQGSAGSNGSDTLDMNGPIRGIQAGYNWQNGNYLLALEADFQGTGQSGTRDFAVSFNNGTAVGSPLTTQGTAAISITQRMPPVRGRVGYVANQWLVYATGGLAYSRIEVNSSASATGFFAPGSLPGALLAQHWGLAQFGALAAAVLRRSDGRLAVAQSWLWVAAGPRSLSTFLLILDHSALVSTGVPAILQRAQARSTAG